MVGETSGYANEDQENFTYIPLSSFIILLVILLTCASRRKKIDPFNTVEQNYEHDIKGEYAVMCFPCLKKKPELDFEPTADLSDQFEYIVEKYTIRKVPLLLANTTEDIIERQEELELTKLEQNQPQLSKDNFANFQVTQDIYTVQKIPPCITVAANTVCPGRKVVKERPKPADILESMSPIPRPPIKNQNYVVIPTKGSLRNKDIMMTKREITNQYLNNFSSVFIDNLKDQVPKDPERFPSLSRPYSSALRNFPIPAKMMKPTTNKKSKRNKLQKVAYAFSAEEESVKEEFPIEEENYYNSDSDVDHTTDVPESEFQEENDNDTGDLTDKSKSLVLLNNSDSAKDTLDCTPSPFKTTIKSSTSDVEQNPAFCPEAECHTSSIFSHKDEWSNSKYVTYEDIQSLDVGYEFTSSEKLGVKPKMTRIHYPHESERLKESLKQLALGDSKISKRCFAGQEQPAGLIGPSRNVTKPLLRTPDLNLSLFANVYGSTLEKTSSKSIIAETSFLSQKNKSPTDTTKEPMDKFISQDQFSTTTFTSKSEENISQSVNEVELNDSENINDSVAEISKLYELSVPAIQRTLESSSYTEETKGPDEQALRLLVPSISRSFDEGGRLGLKKEKASEAKGKDYSPYPNSNPTKNKSSKLYEPETETSCSLYSHESKTSSMVTSPRSSEPDEGKRATLRWKIVIKHHRDENPSRKNVNSNKNH